MSTQHIAFPLLLALAHAAFAESPGTLLRAGMTLVYQADGKPGDRWKVEKVEHDQEHAGQTGVTLIQYAASEPGGAPERRWRRTAGQELHAFDEETGTWEISRPIGPSMTWEKKDGSGRVTTRYETGTATTDRVGDQALSVLETNITFLDDKGQITRRLRERYCLALETATYGVFEIPDPAAPGQWKPTLEFALTEIIP